MAMPQIWHMKNPDIPPIIDAEAEQGINRELVKRYKYRGFEIAEVKFITKPGVPSVFDVVRENYEEIKR